MNESQGILLELYKFLWSQNDFMKQCSTEKVKLNIPDTILFFNGNPVQWFFSKDMQILKKNDDKVNYENIYKFFDKKKRKGDVVAYYISKKKIDEIKSEVEIKQTNIKYFTKTSLKENLEQHAKTYPFGVLQRFIEPVGENNTMIQIMWNQNICFLQQRKNLKNIYNYKYDVNERVCTFDGPEYFSENIPVGNQSIKEIKQISNQINQHLKDLSFGKMKIKSITYYFKCDEDQNIWFLYGQQMILSEKNPKDIVISMIPPKFKLTEDLENLNSIDQNKPLYLTRNTTCLQCQKKYLHKHFVQISLKQLCKIQVDHNEQRIQDVIYYKQLGDNKLYTGSMRDQIGQHNLYFKPQMNLIPLAIRLIYPNMNYQEFLDFKEKSDFAQTQIKICFNCFLKTQSENEEAAPSLAVKPQRKNMKFDKKIISDFTKTFTNGQKTQHIFKEQIKKIQDQKSFSQKHLKNLDQQITQNIINDTQIKKKVTRSLSHQQFTQSRISQIKVIQPLEIKSRRLNTENSFNKLVQKHQSMDLQRFNKTSNNINFSQFSQASFNNTLIKFYKTHQNLQQSQQNSKSFLNQPRFDSATSHNTKSAISQQYSYEQLSDQNLASIIDQDIQDIIYTKKNNRSNSYTKYIDQDVNKLMNNQNQVSLQKIDLQEIFKHDLNINDINSAQKFDADIQRILVQKELEQIEYLNQNNSKINKTETNQHQMDQEFKRFQIYQNNFK